MPRYINENDIYKLFNPRGVAQLHVGDIDILPRVDAVPVDKIRVDFRSLCLENQEAVLNVSICGKPNEVKLPFSKEVMEVVHGRWIWHNKWELFEFKYECSICHDGSDLESNYCPNCGAKMDKSCVSFF